MKTKTTKTTKKTTAANDTTKLKAKVASRERRFFGTKLVQSPYGERGDFVDACEYLDQYIHADRALSFSMLITDSEAAALVMQLVLADASSWGIVSDVPRIDRNIDWKALYDAVANAWATFDTHVSLEVATAAIDNEIDERFGLEDDYGNRSKNGLSASHDSVATFERISFHLRALTHACWAQCEDEEDEPKGKAS